MSHGCLELQYVKIDHNFVGKKLIQNLVFTSDFVTNTNTVTLITESNTACLLPMASKFAGSNVTNDPYPKRWDLWGGLYVVSSLIKSLQVAVVWL